MHDKIQGLNRILEELKQYIHTVDDGTEAHGWQNRIVKRKLDNLYRYLINIRDIELRNRIPEVGEFIQRVQNLLEKIEQDAEEKEYSPTDPLVLTDEPPVKTYVRSAINNLDNIILALELNPREIAKNVYTARHSPTGIDDDFLDMIARIQTQRMPSQRARHSHHASKRKKRKRNTRHGKKKSHKKRKKSRKKRKKHKKSRKLKGGADGAAPAPRPAPARAHVVPGPLPVPNDDDNQDTTQQTEDRIHSQNFERTQRDNVINENYEDENDTHSLFDDFNE